MSFKLDVLATKHCTRTDIDHIEGLSPLFVMHLSRCTPTEVAHVPGSGTRFRGLTRSSLFSYERN